MQSRVVSGDACKRANRGLSSSGVYERLRRSRIRNFLGASETRQVRSHLGATFSTEPGLVMTTRPSWEEGW